MKKSKALSLLLSVAMLVSLAIPGTLALPTRAADIQEDNGMVISKSAVDNGNGSYKITLEAYATGEKITSTVEKDVPTDIVLVLDQSGSMSTEDFPSVGDVTYTAYSGNQTQNSNLYSKRHNNNGNNGNLYYKLEDGSYATVSVTRTQSESFYTYTQCPSDWQNNKRGSHGDRDPDDYWKYSQNLYVKNGANEYQKVELKRENTGSLFSPYYIYTYTFPNGNTVTSEGNDGQPGSKNFDGNGPVYYLSGTTDGEYTYTYTDAEGNAIDIGTSTGANTNFTSATLYYRTVTNGGNITRLQALKNAVTGFNNAVAQKAAGKDGILGTEDDIDHRIAVVGFAARKNTNPGNYINTELFIGATQYTYGSDAQGQYENAFQNMKTTEGQGNVTASIGALAAYGGTHIDLGMEMAKGILDSNPVPSGEKRNRVVIVFTDGSPGSGSWSNNDMTYAQNAIYYADGFRENGANVYTVGIFNGADATSAGNKNGNDTQKANWFMQNLSDNKGTPQTPSYYLSAADSNTLNNIFEQIADNIESGGSSTTLDSNAVIKDIISPQFQLTAGTSADDITLETYSYIGENQWSGNSDAMGATATVIDDQVDVTGFDFSKNWCGTENNNGTTTYRGNKLVISFNVVPKDGFLGGNGVYTNTSAGVYENSNAETPVLEFERPQVDVPINSVTVDPPDKDVYLLQNVSVSELQNGVTAKVGNVDLDLTKADNNWGLEAWQNEYVDITVEVKDKDGNAISSDLTGLTEDCSYTVSVIVSPKTIGIVSQQEGSDEGTINVYKPELTFKDGEAWYGGEVPNNEALANNLTKTKWLHGTTEADVTKMAAAPALIMTYTPDSSKLSGTSINTKQDVPVDVNVKIGGVDISEYTTFEHDDCENKTCSVPTSSEFLLHIKTCNLTIAKSGGAESEPYVFKVLKNGAGYSEITIVGNGSKTIYELPVGTYTIVEDDGWSWRYEGDNGSGVSLTVDNPVGKIICNNTKTKNSWLNGYSGVVQNVFGSNNN